MKKHIFVKSTKTCANWLWDKSEAELEAYLLKHPEVVRVTAQEKNPSLPVDKEG